MGKRRNSNHPKKGSSIKVEPIRYSKDIQAIKKLIRKESRNLALFTLGINTAYRAGELMSLSIGQVSGLKPYDRLDLKQGKDQEYRAISLNHISFQAVQNWLKVHPLKNNPNAPLFLSQRGKQSLTVPAVNRLVKKWCREVSIMGNYGSHSLRKTWGYHQRVYYDVSVALLMKAFGHQSEAQTLDYLCIQANEIQELYMSMEL